MPQPNARLGELMQGRLRVLAAWRGEVRAPSGPVPTMVYQVNFRERPDVLRLMSTPGGQVENTWDFGMVDPDAGGYVVCTLRGLVPGTRPFRLHWRITRENFQAKVAELRIIAASGYVGFAKEPQRLGAGGRVTTESVFAKISPEPLAVFLEALKES